MLPFKATEKTLANGLKVIVVPTGFPNIVSLQIPVQTGSRNEVEPGKSGFAHFFEHMMFRGTPTYPPEKYQADHDARGGAARTPTPPTTTRTTTRPSPRRTWRRSCEVEADRFQNLSYPEAAFKTEARAVLGEYNKNSANPVSKLIEVQREHAFTAHTYKHTTMGFLKDIEDMPNQFEYSQDVLRPLVPARVHDAHRGRRRRPGAGARRWSRSTGAAGSAGSYKVDDPAGAGAARARCTRTCPGRRATLPWVTVAFHGPAFSETEKDFAAIDLLLDLDLRSPPPTCTSGWWRTSRRSTSSSPTAPRNARTRTWSRSARG